MFLFWIAAQYPAVVWPQAWLVAASVLGVDAVAAVWWLRRPQDLAWSIRGTLWADGVLGWAVAWAFSQSPTTPVPILLSLFTFELLAYHPTRRQVAVSAAYMMLTNSALGLVPGIHGLPLWPWARVIFWTIADGLLLGAAVTLIRLPWQSGPSMTALTPREREIYHLAAAGLSATQIAEQLQIAVSTVKTHLHHIHQKLSE